MFSNNHVYPFIITLLFEALVYVFMCNEAYKLAYRSFNLTSLVRLSELLSLPSSCSSVHRKERATLIIQESRGGRGSKAIDIMCWHLWNGRYHFGCNRVLFNAMLLTGLVSCLQSFFQIFLGRCFEREITIESLFVPVSLVGSAGISGSLWGWASTSVHGLCTEHNTCPRCFWHGPASFFLRLSFCPCVPDPTPLQRHF